MIRPTPTQIPSARTSDSSLVPVIAHVFFSGLVGQSLDLLLPSGGRLRIARS